jgi:hypothetical protein
MQLEPFNCLFHKRRVNQNSISAREQKKTRANQISFISTLAYLAPHFWNLFFWSKLSRKLDDEMKTIVSHCLLD